MGEKEERTGNVVAGPAIMGEPWWLISRADGTELCCHRAASWFEARDVGRKLTEHENVSAKQIERKKEKKMGYDAKILADSISPAGHRLTTFEVTFPRIVLSEWNTHRMLSRNSASSRAIPVEKRILQVEADPFVPAAFGKNQKGMQASETLDGDVDTAARLHWTTAMRSSIEQARALEGINVHKQLANRLLEPFSWHTVICTATDWTNFFNLRCHPNAQPEIRTVAEMMRDLYYKSSVPQPLNHNEWHLPMIQRDERIEFDRSDRTDAWMAKISAARCARVSYLTHDGKRDVQADLDLYEKLTTNGHMSPLEHPARPMTEHELNLFRQINPEWRRTEWSSTAHVTHYLGNFNGWVQLRKLIPGESVFVDGGKS
jgi:thymidylate synthase ThyX